MGFFTDLLSNTARNTLKNRLSATKTVICQGVIFKIKRINVMDHLEGTQVIHEVFSTYRTKDQKEQATKAIKSNSKLKGHLRDMIMAGIVKPKLVRKQEEDPDAVHVDEVVNDWILTQQLIENILLFTYGKKK